MKMGAITRSNSRKQVVLSIGEVITKTEKESSYLDLLKKIQGTWNMRDWQSLKDKKQLELKASLKRKQAW